MNVIIDSKFVIAYETQYLFFPVTDLDLRDLFLQCVEIWYFILEGVLIHYVHYNSTQVEMEFLAEN